MIGVIHSAIGAVSAVFGLAGGIHPLRLNQRPSEAVPTAFMSATLLEAVCAGVSHHSGSVGHVVGAGLGAGAAAVLGVVAYDHADNPADPRARTLFSDADVMGTAVALLSGAALGYANGRLNLIGIFIRWFS
jgi:cytochrome bd-type quinol oxidase subunit 1